MLLQHFKKEFQGLKPYFQCRIGSFYSICATFLSRSLSSFNMHKLQCIQNTFSKTVTNGNRCLRAFAILKQLHSLPVEFRCIFKTATLVYMFLHSDHHSYFSPLCLFIVEEMAQDITFQINGSWRFFNSTHQYTNPKNTSATALLLMLPQFRMIYLMMFVLPQLLPVSHKS